MKKLFTFLLIFIGILSIAYISGPKPEAPNLQKSYSYPPKNSLKELANDVATAENTIPGILPYAKAQFVWADSISPKKTKIAFVYIHGFSATHEEGNPVHRNIAKRYGANLYLARLAGHGINLGDSTMAQVTADQFLASAEEALAIGKQMGDEVVLIATSFGGALSTFLASRHPEIKAVVMYSPCIKIFDSNAELLDNPWGLALGEAVNGSAVRDFKAENELHAKHWSTHYHMNGVIALQNFLTHAMNQETFEKVTAPVFMGYYYKSETEQDKVVSVPAMLKMYDQLSSKNKVKLAFANVGNHVLASPILSKDVASVQTATEQFLDKILK
jgi:esterase/lipase